MISKILFFCLLFLFVSCGGTPEKTTPVEEVKSDTIIQAKSAEEALAQEKIADTSTTGNAEFKENIKKIEKKYGEQWDFCKCVVANDSIDKAVKGGNTTDKLLNRFDVVDQHCKSFLSMDANITPEEREKHEKKVKKCLRKAGIRN